MDLVDLLLEEKKEKEKYFKEPEKYAKVIKKSKGNFKKKQGFFFLVRLLGETFFLVQTLIF